jgi:hemerythrin-like metal-binding protein
MTHSLAAPAGAHALPWLPSFAVGHDLLDEEHQDILTSCNHLCALAGHDAPALHLAAHGLIAKLESHFASEEALFPLINYDRYLPHIREHMAVIATLKDLLDGSDTDMTAAVHTCRRIVVEHILRHDLQFKTWILHARGL